MRSRSSCGPAPDTWSPRPRHPLTVRGGPGAQFAHDVEGEMGDVPFVVTSIDDELSDLADVDHLAVAGHSSGAIVALSGA